jgi:hypothetical protein
LLQRFQKGLWVQLGRGHLWDLWDLWVQLHLLNL